MNDIEVPGIALHKLTVLLEYIDHFATIFHKCMNSSIYVFYIFPIILALYLMLLMTYYTQNYACIIGWSLFVKHVIH